MPQGLCVGDIVDTYKFNISSSGGSEDQPPDASKSVDSYFHYFLLKNII